jgi:hypothetical protein
MAADVTSNKAIEDTWFSLRRDYDDAQQRLSKKEDRERLLRDRDLARDAYFAARAKEFDEQDEFIKKTKKELTAATADMKRELASLQNIAAVLKAISSAVKLAATLAGIVVV